MDFALNQKTAPKLGFAAFLDLAAELGCVGVEPRNDLGRPSSTGSSRCARAKWRASGACVSSG